jgi:hypothetical protein
VKRRKVKLIEDIEYLGTQIQALVEAEELAAQAQPKMLSEIRKLYYSAVRKLQAVAKKLLKRRPSLAGLGPRIPMEVLERLFIVLRDQAEIALVRSSKLHGREKKQAMVTAEHLAKLAQTAAKSLKMTAEAKGIWNAAYSEQYGLGPWI